MTAVAELVQGRELLYNLTLRELRGKFKRTALGWTWSMLNPLSSIVIYTIVFSTFLKGVPDRGNPSNLFNFTLWLTCGLLPWNFINTGVQSTLGSLVGNSNLIKKVYFPREYIVAASVLSWLVTFGIELSVMCVVFLFFGQVVFAWIPIALIFIALQTILVLGLSLLLASVNVYFRDVQHFVGIGMQIWFYLTPIVYRTELVHEHLHSSLARKFYGLNPMLRFTDAYRNCFYDQRMPPVQTFVACAVASFAALFLGWAVFSRLEPRFAEEL